MKIFYDDPTKIDWSARVGLFDRIAAGLALHHEAAAGGRGELRKRTELKEETKHEE